MPNARLLALAALVPASVLARGPRGEVVRLALPRSVRVQLHAGGKTVRTASGVVVASRGGAEERTWIMTNAHVVDTENIKGEVVFHILAEAPARDLTAHVVARGSVPDFDLAVLEVKGAVLPAVDFASDAEASVGDDVVVVGAPFGRSLSVAAGIVSQLEGEAMKTDAPIGYGTSGGGIFEVPSGKLIGVVEGYRTARVAFQGATESYGFDVPMPGETFASPVAKIRRFMQEKGLGHLLTNETAAKL